MPRLCTSMSFAVAVMSAAAEDIDPCLHRAATLLHPQALYLARKQTLMGSAIAVSIPAPFPLPSSAEKNPVPSFKKAAAGIAVFNTAMPSFFAVYDRPVSSVVADGTDFTEENLDEIGWLVSHRAAEPEHLIADAAKGTTLTPALQKFMQAIAACVTPR